MSTSAGNTHLHLLEILLSCVRINLSVALVAMVGVDHHNHSDTGVCPGRGPGDERVVVTEGEFDWSKSEQGLVTGSYYWSYTAAQVGENKEMTSPASCLQIPSAWLASRLGFKRVFGVSMFLSALVTLLFPLCARSHVYLALTARVLVGLFHAVSFPAMTGAWGAWAPPLEITK